MLIISPTVIPPPAPGAARMHAAVGSRADGPAGDLSSPAAALATEWGAGLSPSVGGLPGAGPREEGWGAAARAGEGAGGRGQALARATRVLNRLLEESPRRLKFNVHEGTGRIWVQVIDLETNEVVKEIPPERYLDLVARIWELVGLLVDEHA